MSPAPAPVEDDHEYNSASDEDFNPDAPHAEDEVEDSSSDGSDGETDLKSKTTKKAPDDLNFDNSGDEATISKGKRKKRKLAHASKREDDDESGGEGGLIKTRAQRRTEKQEKKPLVQASKASVNVDELWAQMSGPAKASQGDTAGQESQILSKDGSTNSSGKIAAADDAISKSTPQLGVSTDGHQTSEPEATVTIKRSYQFAGQKLEEERVVAASSAEAKLYLEEQSKNSAMVDVNPKSAMRRPKKRASMFDDPVGNSEKLGEAAKAAKLTTLEKSKLDWAAHVDREGISDELDEHRRAKGGYLGRMDFLGRMDAKQQEELQKAKLR